MGQAGLENHTTPPPPKKNYFIIPFIYKHYTMLIKIIQICYKIIIIICYWTQEDLIVLCLFFYHAWQCAHTIFGISTMRLIQLSLTGKGPKAIIFSGGIQ